MLYGMEDSYQVERYDEVNKFSLKHWPWWFEKLGLEANKASAGLNKMGHSTVVAADDVHLLNATIIRLEQGLSGLDGRLHQNTLALDRFGKKGS